ncbi:MAG: phosphogluconate dehydratase [Aquabacterium sp.]|jgi:phosphogluconate dehydratase|uniref:phosphogluconate dehydratase n=1 Tax=Aquabacterium sp. TaxID=1872578 RepID=UPI002A3690E1|nr:phosphogluconate dehydratase [Aquabacterium sp.]MDX9843671.1 phosphogluconate dehydratase [Aquabacterium sp.]
MPIAPQHPPLHDTVRAVTDRIRARSAATRAAYLQRIDAAARDNAVERAHLGCTNLAHGYAAAPAGDKIWLRQQRAPNIAIVSSYNDMLSAHQPLAAYPDWIKQAAREMGATAQFAGGVPAMCDGVTQGQPGMELSLFSRDVIAMATAVALSHNMFDATLCLGVCDKIVPGLLIGALSFGHLPTLFVPAGPMGTGQSNEEKAKVRQRHAAGELDDAALLAAEEKSYHGPGTCTFYGTANSNQMLMEIMGLHLPGTAFVPPGTALREALTRASAQRVVQLTRHSTQYTPVGQVVDERAVVNGIVGLLATGGSTNHTLHLVAIARAAGIIINWDDFDALSNVVPLLARVYPNGSADVNAFQAAGGVALVIRELLDVGLLHADVRTVAGPEGLWHYTQQPVLHNGSLTWVDAPAQSGDPSIISTEQAPFSPDGGLKLLQGNLGRAVIKVSAVRPAHRVVEAPALVVHSQQALHDAYQRGELNRDVVAVVIGQGPRANGMPELHALTPLLTNLQDQGFKVALVTDGRMSGASGKVPAAIHVTPEVLAGGPLGKLRTGDLVRLDAEAGTLEALVPEAEWAARPTAALDVSAAHAGTGRELFGGLRQMVSGAEQGAMTFGWTEQSEA